MVRVPVNYPLRAGSRGDFAHMDHITHHKKTGLMSGDFDTSELSDSRVFKGGTTGSSFKAMYFSQDVGRWLILEIQTNSKGEEQPFKIIYLMGIVTGLCK